MDLELKAYLAVLKVRKIHQEIELSDYIRVMKHYNPSIKEYELIVDRVAEINEEISRLDNLIKEAK